MTRLPHPRFLAFLAVLAGAAALFWRPFGPERAFTLGFDLAAAVFAALAYPLWRETGPEGLRLRAARDDGGRVLLPAVALLAVAAVLVSLGRMLAAPGRAPGEDLALVLGTLFLAWAFGNLVAAFHYAHLFYARRGGAEGQGLDFPGGGAPVFGDFCYFAFVIGMTCQTADVGITSTVLRRAVLVHGVLAFVFNLGVLALTINVLAGAL